MFANAFSGLKAWYASPFTPNMSALRWGYLVGLVLISLVVWKILISHLMDV